MMFDLSISWLAVFIATLSSGFVGWFWYNPKVFGTAWADSQGFQLESLKMHPLDLAKEMGSSLITAIVLAMFYDWSGSQGLWDGLVIGFWAGLGFVATSQFSAVIWAKLPLKTYLINAGAAIVTLMVMGAIIGLIT